MEAFEQIFIEENNKMNHGGKMNQTLQKLKLTRCTSTFLRAFSFNFSVYNCKLNFAWP